MIKEPGGRNQIGLLLVGGAFGLKSESGFTAELVTTFGI